MLEEGHELCCLARVGYEHDCVVLFPVSIGLVAQALESRLTFLMSPRSPCSASAACMKELAIPRLFMVATILRPTSPLFPTPHIMSLPPVWLTFVRTSTARRRPSRATWSDSYKKVTCDRAVAAVESTLTARDRRRDPSGSFAASGGVSGCASEAARFLLSEAGGGVERGSGVAADVAVMLV